MLPLLFLGCVAFLLSLFLTPQVRNLSRRFNVVDHPDADRKLHPESVPRVGGIAIVGAFVLSLCILVITGFRDAEWAREHIVTAVRLAPAVLVVFLVGLLDDLFNLKPWPKVGGQVVACVLAYLAGVHLNNVAGFQVPPVLALPVTVFWLLVCTNAFNLIDGVDGLAAGVGLFASLTVFVAALLNNNHALMLLTVPLVGALLGFLRYNFNPASIFMGDSGALFVGFVLGCYGILWAQKSATILGVTAPLMAMAIPLLDTSLAIARRFLRRQPIFSADRAHIHHQLLARGMKPRGVALILYAVGGGFATLSLLMSQMQDRYSGLILVLFCAVTWIGVQHLGYLEFGTASRMLIAGAFRRLLNAQMELNSYQLALERAQTAQECWDVLSNRCREFGFTSAVLCVAGQTYDDNVKPNHAENWTLHIATPNGDTVVLSRPHDSELNATMVAHFADVTRRILAQKNLWPEYETSESQAAVA